MGSKKYLWGGGWGGWKSRLEKSCGLWGGGKEFWKFKSLSLSLKSAVYRLTRLTIKTGAFLHLWSKKYFFCYDGYFLILLKLQIYFINCMRFFTFLKEKSLHFSFQYFFRPENFAHYITCSNSIIEYIINIKVSFHRFCDSYFFK